MKAAKHNDPTRTKYWGVHKAKILYLDGERTRIDRDIAPLIEALYKLGIRTFNSCQATCGGWCDRKHLATKRVTYQNSVTGKKETYWKREMPRRCRESIWLCFQSADDATRFMRAVSRPADPENLYHQMQGQERKNHPHRWIWRTGNYGGWGRDRDDPKAPFKFFHVLIMPRAHLAMVTGRVQELVK